MPTDYATNMYFLYIQNGGGGVAIVRDRMNTNGVSDDIMWTYVKVKSNVKNITDLQIKVRYVHKISWQLLPNYTVVSYVIIFMCKCTYNTVFAVATEPL